MREELLRQVLAVGRGIPGLLWRLIVGGLLGGLVGLLLGGLSLALMVGLAPNSPDGITGTVLGAFSLTAITLGGIYVGALKGCARGLAELVDQLVLVPKLWTLIQPYVREYASQARAGVKHTEARARALGMFRSAESATTEGATDLAERAERYVAGLLYGVLAGGLLRGLLGRGDATWEDLERDGVARANQLVGDVVAQLFHGPALLGMILTVTAVVAPYLVHALLVSDLFP